MHHVTGPIGSRYRLTSSPDPGSEPWHKSAAINKSANCYLPYGKLVLQSISQSHRRETIPRTRNVQGMADCHAILSRTPTALTSASCGPMVMV